jgi:hypothetical protein
MHLLGAVTKGELWIELMSLSMFDPSLLYLCPFIIPLYREVY